jgi:ABC-type sugar transport system permease subunit
MLHKQKRKLILPFLLPGLILYLVFYIYPAIKGFQTSLYDWSGFNLPSTFIGLDNYRELLHDEIFWSSVKVTLTIMLVGGIFIFGVAFFFTALLNSGIRGKKFFRAVIFFPNVIAAIALSTFWAFVYNNRFGLLNSFLRLLKLDNLIIQWTNSDNILGSIIVAMIWIYVGYFLVILLAGADKISPEIFDAAKVDGANMFQTFFFITIPLMWDIIGIALLLWMITAIKQFEFLYSFGGGTAVKSEIWTMPIYLVIMGFGKRDPIFRLGMASAIGVGMLLLVIIFAAIIRRILKRNSIQY